MCDTLRCPVGAGAFSDDKAVGDIRSAGGRANRAGTHGERGGKSRTASGSRAGGSKPQAVAPGTTSAEKIGEENEALRNLLLDAGMKIRQFDEYKIAFGKLIEPATQALRTLEQEKTNNVELRRKLEQSVARCDQLRARTHELETRHAILIGENEKLRQELDLARVEARDAERSRAEFANETSPRAASSPISNASSRLKTPA